MTGPPATTATTDGNLTDLRPTRKRNRRAEADRHRMMRTPLHRRIVGMMRRAGHQPEAWQVESLAATLVANRAEPSDEQIITELMRAEWWPKPRVRRHGIGGPGWRVSS